jgi:hypothetical protein
MAIFFDAQINKQTKNKKLKVYYQSYDFFKKKLRNKK